MSDCLRLFLAILVIGVLVIIFIVSFILYKKTPVPKGCEEIEKPSETKCRGCNEKECQFNLYYNKSKDDENKKED